MAILEKPEDLAAAPGEVIGSNDLIAKGFTLSASLQKEMAEAEPAKVLTPQERHHWAQRAKEVGSVKFNVRTIDFVHPGLAKGEYDFIFSVQPDDCKARMWVIETRLTWMRN